ncbi:hypothetical protein CR513_02967, partial [Mucuna pruriens]
MANTKSESEEEDEVIIKDLNHLHFAYQELLSNSSIRSIGYIDLKKKISKLLKEVESLQKENENKILKEKQVTCSSNDNTSQVIELRQEELNLSSKYLKKILKDRRHPNDKCGIGYDKGKDLKKKKSTSKSFNYGKNGHTSFDSRSCPKKRSSNISKTNKKGPKQIKAPKSLLFMLQICLTI